MPEKRSFSLKSVNKLRKHVQRLGQSLTHELSRVMSKLKRKLWVKVGYKIDMNAFCQYLADFYLRYENRKSFQLKTEPSSGNRICWLESFRRERNTMEERTFHDIFVYHLNWPKVFFFQLVNAHFPIKIHWVQEKKRLESKKVPRKWFRSATKRKIVSAEV